MKTPRFGSVFVESTMLFSFEPFQSTMPTIRVILDAMYDVIKLEPVHVSAAAHALSRKSATA